MGGFFSLSSFHFASSLAASASKAPLRSGSICFHRLAISDMISLLPMPGLTLLITSRSTEPKRMYAFGGILGLSLADAFALILAFLASFSAFSLAFLASFSALSLAFSASFSALILAFSASFSALSLAFSASFSALSLAFSASFSALSLAFSASASAFRRSLSAFISAIRFGFGASGFGASGGAGLTRRTPSSRSKPSTTHCSFGPSREAGASSTLVPTIPLSGKRPSLGRNSMWSTIWLTIQASSCTTTSSGSTSSSASLAAASAGSGSGSFAAASSTLSRISRTTSDTSCLLALSSSSSFVL